MFRHEDFWKNKKVFVTGHTGFKGAWICLLLHHLGAEVTGYALGPPTDPSIFKLCKIDKVIKNIRADIRNFKLLKKTLLYVKPDIVFHMAAQSLVLKSYENPLETYSVNVMGTVHVLEAIRRCETVRAAIMVTSDKCYQNNEWIWGYREGDPMGGFDPYSNSKGCSELTISAYRNSFFSGSNYSAHKLGLASVRAGNVIGGGDWSDYRLIPDCIKAFSKGEEIIIRCPESIRPWQHVLEPLSGYLILAEKLYKFGSKYSEAWNFGPDCHDEQSVKWMVKRVCEEWGKGASFKINKGNHPHEANYLKLDCSKAKARLGWRPKWNLDQAIKKVVEWFKAYKRNEDMNSFSISQIDEYLKR